MNLGPFEMVVILVVALLLFGPKNLPKLGNAMGKTIRGIREGMEDGEGVMGEGEKGDAPASNAVFCTHCGAKNAADAAFCSSCGTKLEPKGEVASADEADTSAAA